jgi:diacylglycerol kinase (ATP)
MKWMTSLRALVLLNCKPEQPRQPLERGLSLLREAGFELLTEEPESVEESRRLIAEHAGRLELVIVGGGDGTLNAVADRLIETGLPLGIIPLGTANDLARTLMIPVDPVQACAVIAEGRLHRIDLGQVNGKHFFNVASFGLSEAVARRLSGLAKRRWGIISYAISLFDAIKALRSFGVEIEHEGGRAVWRSILIAVGNGRHYGGGMTIADDARIDDARLDLTSLNPQKLWRLLLLLPALRRGVYAQREVFHTLQGRWFRIRTKRRMAINTDGELTTATPAEFKLLPSALAVYVPSAYFE